MLMRSRPLLLLLWLAAALPQAVEAAWFDRTEAIMGTRIYVQLWAEDATKGNEAIDAVMAEMRRIDELMSHYKPESELSQINERANREPVQVDQELFELIKLSTYYSQITEGAFDITYASVGYLYDYPKHVHPTEAQIKSALPGVNWRNMLLDEAQHTVRFEHPGMRIDLGGIGKGYAVDRGVAILKARGIDHAVVTAGGDTRIIGDHMGRPWLVAIRHPDNPQKVVTRIPLSDAAMSTSGRLRALLRRGRRALPPHHRPAHRSLGEQGAQRHHHRPDGDADRRHVEDRIRARVLRRRWRSSTACPSTTRCSSPRRARCSTPTGCGRRIRVPGDPEPPATGTSPRG